MATLTVSTSSSDGRVAKSHATYLTAHDAASGTANHVLTEYSVGQEVSGANKVIWRSFVYFDTSALPDDETIISAKLSFYLAADYSDTDFNIVIRSGMPTYPHDPLVDDDFDYTFYTGNGGSLNTENLVSGWNDILLNSTGRGWINKTGVTKLALISSRDISATEPTGRELISIWSVEYPGSVPPKLVITYAAEEALAVTTNDPTGIKDTHCTANGNITAGEVATEKGFEYGLANEATWAVRTTIVSGEGAYSLTITNLLPETTYYVRAWVLNSLGYAYGEWVEFTTTASSSYGIYEESNVATICFYVRRAGGKWSIKHGPYTTDQADIEISKILTEGKGKYQIKFTSDVLTGLSVNIMTKLDIKAR